MKFMNAREYYLAMSTLDHLSNVIIRMKEMDLHDDLMFINAAAKQIMLKYNIQVDDIERHMKGLLGE